MKVRSNLNNPSGVKDFNFIESKVRDKIKNTLKVNFDKYGFNQLETSILNLDSVLSSKYAGGAEILKEMYRIDERNSEGIALRYDLTVPFMKYVAMNYDGKLPIKRYEIGKVFRNGPVKRGRLREFTQCDVDVVGIKSLMCESELLSLSSSIFKELEVDVITKINSIKILEGLLEEFNFDSSDYRKVILSIDKWEKIGYEGVYEDLVSKSIDKGKSVKLLDYLLIVEKEGISYLSKLSNDKVKEGTDEVLEVMKYVNVEFDPFLARGLEIYSGIVYEVFIKNSEITSSVASGGRYDGKIDKMMRKRLDLPVVGISFGLDVILDYMVEKNNIIGEVDRGYYVIPLGTEKECFKLVNNMRQKGIKVEMEMDRKKLGKALKFADSKGYEEVFIIGTNEVEKGMAKIKNLKEGTEREIWFSQNGW